LRAFAASVEAFEGNESSAPFHSEIITSGN
jgi:hypothetical protein